MHKTFVYTMGEGRDTALMYLTLSFVTVVHNEEYGHIAYHGRSKVVF